MGRAVAVAVAVVVVVVVVVDIRNSAWKEDATKRDMVSIIVVVGVRGWLVEVPSWEKVEESTPKDDDDDDSGGDGDGGDERIVYRLRLGVLGEVKADKAASSWDMYVLHCSCPLVE
jgi:hypothetical protein